MYPDIFPNEVGRWKKDGARIVDVRETWEYAQGHIPGSEDIPLGKLIEHLANLKGPLVLVCASGGRSASAAEYLAHEGFQKVANLMGGTFGWVQSGLGVE